MLRCPAPSLAYSPREAARALFPPAFILPGSSAEPGLSPRLSVCISYDTVYGYAVPCAFQILRRENDEAEPGRAESSSRSIK